MKFQLYIVSIKYNGFLIKLNFRNVLINIKFHDLIGNFDEYIKKLVNGDKNGSREYVFSKKREKQAFSGHVVFLVIG